jgi:chromosome segregation ATPase
MRDNRDLTNEEMLKTVVDEFKEAIQASAGKEMTALGNTLGDLNEQFSAQASGMATSHAEMVASTHEIIDKVSTVLKESVDGLSNTLENIDFAASAMSETANKFLSVTEQLSGSFEQLETVSRRLENVSLTLEEAGDGLKELNSSQLQAVTEIREGVDKVHTSQETISRAWEAYSKRFDQVDSHLEKFFVGLQEGLVGYTEQVNKFLHDIDGHLANSVDKLGGASGEINENVENLSDQLDALRHVFASLNQATSTPV